MVIFLKVLATVGACIWLLGEVWMALLGGYDRGSGNTILNVAHLFIFIVILLGIWVN